MSLEIVLILLIFALGFAALIFIINKRLSEIGKTDPEKERLIKLVETAQQYQLQGTKQVTDTLQQNTKEINERLDRAARVIGDLQKEAGQFSEVSRSMRKLQEFLQSPKLRGNIGEEVLRDLLEQTFPKNSIHLQYQFKGGQKVDAALKTDAGILPIDSKFPMENFEKMIGGQTDVERERGRREFGRDVRKHIDAISEKYILPEEGTVDFAIMYIPSESVYYEIVNLPEIIKYARDKRVYPVSPTTLYAHLRIILLSFEGKKIEEQARFVLSSIRSIQKDYEKTEGVLQTLGRHVGNAYNTMASLASSFTQLGQKISSTQLLDKQEKPMVKLLRVKR